MASQISAPDIGYGNVYIDALVGGNYKWDSEPITYALGTTGQTIDETRTLTWTEAEKTIFSVAFQSYAAVCGITFIEVDYSASVNLAEWKMAVVLNDPYILGLHYAPEGGTPPAPLDGEYATATNYWSITPGSVGYTTIVHELGHALGLAHPHDGGWGTHPTKFPGLNDWPFDSGYGDYALNQGIWTVMSYNDGWNQERGPAAGDYGDVITPMAFDVATLQALYGANMSTGTGNDIYQLPTANGIGTGWSCIWDAGGSDTISNAGSVLACTINLLAAPLTGANAGGYVSWIRGVAGGFTIANGAQIENAVGGDGNDAITGNSADNNLQGGAGNDTLTGGAGNDTIIGGEGSDDLGFSGPRSAYAVRYQGGIYTITSADGVDKVSGVESFRFSDASFTEAGLMGHAPGGSVTISGSLIQGQILTASNTLTDEDGLGAISWQWLRSGSAIADATASHYSLTQADVGQAISVQASYLDGINSAERVTSAAATIANINDTPAGSVILLGVATQNQTLRAINEITDADGLGAISWQWRRAGSAITGADQDTYVLTQADVGKVISVKASYTDGGATYESMSSSATKAVVNANDAPEGSVTITGIPVQGQVLTASNTLTDADGLGLIRYQWQADGVDISGANTARFSPSAPYVGTAITVKASYTDEFGAKESVLSAPTDVLVASKLIMKTSAYVGTNYGDWIIGTNGNDSIKGQAGADTLTGEEGNDSLAGGSGNDLLNGGNGDDLILQDDVTSRDTIAGGSGFDSVDYSALGASLNVHRDTGRIEKILNGVLVSADTLSDIESIIGTRYQDTFAGSASDDIFNGGAGNDVISGAAGDDVLNGGDGRDSLSGGEGNDYLSGQAGDDTLNAGEGDNIINGGTGNDILGDVTGNNTYIFGANFGRDTMTNWRMPGYLNDTDIVQFIGIDARTLLFQRDGNDLKITVAGKPDLLKIMEWYDTSADQRGLKHFQIDQFQAGELVLHNDVVNDLVTIVGAPPISMANLISAGSGA